MKQLTPLAIVLLMPNCLLAETRVCSSVGTDTLIVSATWDSTSSPYIICGDVRVGSLTIEPGVRVLFEGFHRIRVEGSLEANGTSQDSIIFARSDAAQPRWNTIWFINASGTSTLRYCRISGAANSGVNITNSESIVEHCMIGGNTKAYGSFNGGGVGVQISNGKSLTLRDCAIVGNVSQGHGGGLDIQSNGPVTLERCEVTGNTAEPPTPSSGGQETLGGGIRIVGDALLERCTIKNNWSRSQVGNFNVATARGGGVFLEDGSSRLVACDIQNNTSWARSGNAPGGAAARAVSGGVEVRAGSVIIQNCKIVANNLITEPGVGAESVRSGGGTISVAGSTDIWNTVIADNDAEGLFLGSAATVGVTNGILWGNAAEEIVGSPTVRYSIVQGGYPGDGNKEDNPLFDPDYFCTDGSPCTDMGDPSSPGDGCFTPSRGACWPDVGAQGGPFACLWIDEDPHSCPVAVLFHELTATQAGSDVIVTWRTSMESGVSAFRVYRSFDGGLLKALTPDVLPEPGGNYEFKDPSVRPGMYSYRVAEIAQAGNVSFLGGTEIEVVPVPTISFLHQNAPNPFNPGTNIRFSLANDTHVQLLVYNVAGQVVRTLVDDNLTGHQHSVPWNGLDDAGAPVSSGIYFYRLETADFTDTRKMVVVR